MCFDLFKKQVPEEQVVKATDAAKLQAGQAIDQGSQQAQELLAAQKAKAGEAAEQVAGAQARSAMEAAIDKGAAGINGEVAKEQAEGAIEGLKASLLGGEKAEPAEAGAPIGQLAMPAGAGAEGQVSNDTTSAAPEELPAVSTS